MGMEYNSIGLFWGWFFFRGLRSAGAGNWSKVVGGAVAILAGAVVLAYASSHEGAASPHRAFAGMAVAIGARLMFGTMDIPMP